VPSEAQAIDTVYTFLLILFELIFLRLTFYEGTKAQIFLGPRKNV